MTVQNRFELPPVLEPHRDLLEKTARPAIHITAQKGNPSLFQSKFGGSPYLPLTSEHPKDENGRPMMLLAQLNFEELPPLSHLPKKGILQFFISYEDDVYGLDFDDQTSQKNFRTVFHSEVVADESLLVTDFTYLNDISREFVPFEGEYELSFQVKQEPISMFDYRFEKLTSGVLDLDEKVEVNGETVDLWDVCADTLLGNGHKIGGFPYFTQSDPREMEDRYPDYEILLLQIDTDYDQGKGTEIMWGDAGVANFFIKEEDLRNLDFSKVMYNWDCS